MNKGDLKGKKITVMGLGLHGGGVGIIKFLAEAGVEILVTDSRPESELTLSLEKLKNIPNIKYILGRHREEDFLSVDMIIKNPGVPWTNKYIQLALEKNIAVEIDSSLFFKLCKNAIIGVTGTRGKTTTASLICEILRTDGKNPMEVGIGQVSVLDKLNELKDDSIVVFELSSWRLSALGHHKLSPQIAVITNIYPDHLNYYASMQDYIADKKNIFLNQKADNICIVNRDNEIVKNFVPEIKSKLLEFSSQEIVRGAYVKNKKIYFNSGVEEEVIETADIKMRGEHNVSNVLAAICAAKSLNIKNEDIKKAVANFKGVPHRMEFVREIDGVKYFNDTTATSPEGAIAGLNSFSEKIVLIAGGADKNLDMTQLAKYILEKTKAVVFLQGAATDKIISVIKGINNSREFIIVDSMAKAVDEARKLASAGDVILLSPGSASFGLFKNEFDRGDKFKEAVNNLQ